MAAIGTESIGAVSELLKDRISGALSMLPVHIGAPEGAPGGRRALNLFLYRVAFDPHLRNEPLDRGQPAPLWLVLHYLLTAFDSEGDSDSADAHRLLGQGIAVLQQLNFIHPTVAALLKNPEPLKITFDDADVELVSKVLQGPTERFRVSAAVQVRPVMVPLETPAEYSPLVTSIGPPLNPGIAILPTMGARLEGIDPQRFVAGTWVTLRGVDLAGYDTAILGARSLPVSPGSQAGTVRFRLPAAAAMAADSYTICVARTLPSGRIDRSNALLAELMPTVAAAGLVGALTRVGPGATAPRHGTFSVDGTQLGDATSDVFAALFRNGHSHVLLEPDAGGTQTHREFTVTAAQALPPGDYRVVLRVNGQQASNSPVLAWN